LNVLAIEDAFPPELTSARLPYEFAKELARRGHGVTVVTIFPRSYLTVEKISTPRTKFFYWNKSDGFLVLRTRPMLRAKSLVTRFLEYAVIPFTVFLGGFIAGKRKDLIHCQTPPLTVAFAACLLSKVTRKPLVLRIQDIHPDALVKIGVLRNPLLIGLFEIMEKFVYRCSSHITVISEGYKRHVTSRGTEASKVSLIPNWADIDAIKPPDGNDFRERMGLENSFIITYAGTMSWPQDLETVVESADILKNYRHIVFLMIGDGVQKESLVRKSKELKLDNMKYMPLQPRNEYFKILYTSDACIVPLKKQFTSPTAPSKMLEIMACGKPMITNVPSNSDVQKIINDAQCGIWVEPEDPRAFSQAVLMLYKDKHLAKLLGRKGKEFVEKRLSLTKCMDVYESLITRAANTSK
jgi:glycosyltransferase involved in cell wall biosynthesis